MSEPKSEEIVCEYRGRVFTRGVASNGQPIIHYFEGDDEYGIVATEPISVVLDALKFDIDVRDGIKQYPFGSPSNPR